MSDRQDHDPYRQPPAPGYGPPPRKKRHVGRWVLASFAAVVLIIVIAAVAGSGGKKNNTGSTTATTAATAATTATATGGAISNSSGSHPAAADVRLASCSVDDAGYATSSVVVTNHSSKTSNYIITVVFTTKTGAQLGTGETGVNNLESGQSSTPQEANSLATASAGSFTCKVGEVTRYATAG